MEDVPRAVPFDKPFFNAAQAPNSCCPAIKVRVY
jgi:hypothetical protein